MIQYVEMCTVLCTFNGDKQGFQNVQERTAGTNHTHTHTPQRFGPVTIDNAQDKALFRVETVSQSVMG